MDLEGFVTPGEDGPGNENCLDNLNDVQWILSQDDMQMRGAGKEQDLIGKVEKVPEVIKYGTVNICVVLKNGILMGVDGRCSVTDMFNGQEVIKVQSENNKKYLVLSFKTKPKVILTFTGNQRRSDAVRKCLEEEIDGGDFSVEQVLERVIAYLKKHPEKDKEVQTFIGGYSTDEEVYVVYRTNESEIDKKYSSRSGNSYGAIGGMPQAVEGLVGGGIQSVVLYKNALFCMKVALQRSCVYHHSCGGDLNVVWMSKDGTDDNIINMSWLSMFVDTGHQVGHPNSLFFFSSEEGFENMNYLLLRECLKNHQRSTRNIPCYIGVLDNMKIFLVRFREDRKRKADESAKTIDLATQVYSEGGIEADLKPRFRTCEMYDKKGKKHKFLICFADHLLVKDILESGIRVSRS